MVFLAGIQVAKSQMVCRPIIASFLFSFAYCTESFSRFHRGRANGLHTKLMENRPLLRRVHTSGSRDEDVYKRLSQNQLQPVSSFTLRAESRQK